MNYYEILEVSPSARKEVIETAYEVLRKKHQSEQSASTDFSDEDEYIRYLNEAKEVLTNSESRKQYDEYLKRTNIPQNGTTNSSIYSKLVVSKPRPWVRYFARILDLSLGSLLVGIVLSILTPNLYLEVIERYSDFVLGAISVIIWMPFESMIIAKTGTTLGKWLLGTKVVSLDGTKLSYKNSIIRSYNLVAFGMFFGVPILSLFTIASSYIKLSSMESLRWDVVAGSKVIHEKLNVIKVIVYILLMGFISYLIALSSNV
ncbi:MAG: RDD family protein [Clostridiaceae bacterium]